MTEGRVTGQEVETKNGRFILIQHLRDDLYLGCRICECYPAPLFLVKWSPDPEKDEVKIGGTA